MMVANLDSNRIDAVRGLEHRPDYRCPVCAKPVVLHARPGGWVIPHFKHKLRSTCSHERGETPAHRAVKELLRDHYRAKGCDVKVEFEIGKRRADVVVAGLAGPKIAFEVEFSPKEASEFVAKCKDYAMQNVRSAWILRQKTIKAADVEVGKTFLISMSRVHQVLSSKQKPRGAQISFFAYDDRVAVVFRGKTSSHMLYKPYDEYSGYGGNEYPSRSKRWLTVTEVIRETHLQLLD